MAVWAKNTGDLFMTTEINNIFEEQFTDADMKLVEKYRKEVYAWQLAQGIAMFVKSMQDPTYRTYLQQSWNFSSKMNKLLEKMRKQFSLEMYNAVIKQINYEVEMFRNQCCISAEYWKENIR